MFVFVSGAIVVLLAALAALYASAKTSRWTAARLIVSVALTLAGLVTCLVTRIRFSSLEAYNEWALDAFAQHSRPLILTVAVAVFILAASVLTAKGNKKTKTVVCLAAAAGFALFVFGYTALFAVMTKGGALSVDRYICVRGCAFAACFGAVDLTAEAKRLYGERRTKKEPTPDAPDDESTV